MALYLVSFIVWSLGKAGWPVTQKKHSHHPQLVEEGSEGVQEVRMAADQELALQSCAWEGKAPRVFRTWAVEPARWARGYTKFS